MKAVFWTWRNKSSGNHFSYNGHDTSDINEMITYMSEADATGSVLKDFYLKYTLCKWEMNWS